MTMFCICACMKQEFADKSAKCPVMQERLCAAKSDAGRWALVQKAWQQAGGPKVKSTPCPSCIEGAKSLVVLK